MSVGMERYSPAVSKYFIIEIEALGMVYILA
jgi:hypothetical protein